MISKLLIALCLFGWQELDLFGSNPKTESSANVDLSLFSPVTDRDVAVSKMTATKIDPMLDLFAPIPMGTHSVPAVDLKHALNIVPPPKAADAKHTVYAWTLEKDCPPCTWFHGERHLLEDRYRFVDGAKVWPRMEVKGYPTFMWKTLAGDWKRISGYYGYKHLESAVENTRLLPKSQPERAIEKAGVERKVNLVDPSLKVSEDELNADSQPTPIPGVIAMLDRLKPKPDEVLIDPGCGFDARVLISAVRDYGTKKAVGIEIVPELAESARQYVADAGYSDRINIITGDSTKLDWNADIGAAYMWPEVLEKLRPKIQSLDRFVSFDYEIPGLKTQKSETDAGKTHLWTRSTVSEKSVTPIVRTVNAGIIHLPRGSYCQICGRYCSAPMAHKLQQQIVGYK